MEYNSTARDRHRRLVAGVILLLGAPALCAEGPSQSTPPSCEQILRQFEAIPQDREAPVDLLLQAGACYRLAGNPGRAAALFSAALFKEPDNREAKQGLVLALFDQGNQQEALRQLGKEATAQPATNALPAIAPSNPPSPAVVGDIAVQLLGARRLQEAEQLTESALSRNPQDPASILARARVLGHKSLWAEAAGMIDRMPATSAPPATAAFVSDLLRRAFAEATPEALRQIEDAAARSPDSPTLAATRVVALAALGKADDAISRFEALPDPANQPIPLLEVAAGCYETSRRDETAIRWYLRILERDPKNRQAWRRLVTTHAEQKGAAPGALSP